MPPEIAGNIVVLDLYYEDARLMAKRERVDPGSSMPPIQTKVSWYATEPPPGYFSIGEGVAFVRTVHGSEPGKVINKADVDRLDPVTFSSPDGHSFEYRDVVEGEGFMLIVVLPRSYTLSDATPKPIEPKIVKGRLAFYWMLYPANGKRISAKWTMRPIEGDIESELKQLKLLVAGSDEKSHRLIEVEDVTKPIHLFISYSHRDKRYRDQLETALALLHRQGKVHTWHDRLIAPGMEWGKDIDANLEAAQIILFLISADFIASDYAYGVEMKRALQRHEGGKARVIPILVRPTDWKTAPFAPLQALPEGGKPVTKWKNRDDAWTNVTQGIRKVVDELRGGGE